MTVDREKVDTDQDVTTSEGSLAASGKSIELPLEVQETINRLKALLLSSRFSSEVGLVIATGISLLERHPENHAQILTGTAISAISYQKRLTPFPNVKTFNAQYGTRGFYPIPLNKLPQAEAMGFESCILATGKAALAKEIPFDPNLFAGTGFFNTYTYTNIKTRKNGIFRGYKNSTLKYKELYEQQENARNWRIAGRFVLVVLSAIPFIFPAYFTYKWAMRKNMLDRASAEHEEIQLVKLSTKDYLTYKSPAQNLLRKNFKTEKHLNQYKIGDKPNKTVIYNDKSHEAYIYMDKHQKARFLFFKNEMSHYTEEHPPATLLKNLPVTSCVTLRHRS
jgi:hypothetical protein